MAHAGQFDLRFGDTASEILNFGVRAAFNKFSRQCFDVVKNSRIKFEGHIQAMTKRVSR